MDELRVWLQYFIGWPLGRPRKYEPIPRGEFLLLKLRKRHVLDRVYSE